MLARGYGVVPLSLSGSAARFGAGRSVSLAAILGLALGTGSLAETRTYDFTGFETISVSEGIRVLVDEGDDFAVEADSPRADHLDRLEIELRGNRLSLGMEDRRFARNDPAGSTITVRITMPALTGAQVSSGALLAAETIGSDLVDLNASSGGHLDIDTFLGGDLSVTVSSGAWIEVTQGVCETLIADVASGASLRLTDVVCVDVTVAASSGAWAEVHATGALRATASSGGRVRVLGNTSEPADIDTASGGVVDFP